MAEERNPPMACTKFGIGVFERIINEAQEKYGVSKNIVPQSTIWSRFLQNMITCKHKGTSTSMHIDKLVSQRGVEFGHNCSKWCSYKNFDTMYNLVY